LFCSFFGGEVSWFLLGVLAKSGGGTWFFAGELMVFGVVEMVRSRSLIWLRKIRQGFRIYFHLHLALHYSLRSMAYSA
jgi:hypothetical protein